MKKLIMAIKTLGKVMTRNQPDQTTPVDTPPPSTLDFTENELGFILTKLRSANYTGAEFDMFYTVWMKLVNLQPKK